LADWRTIGYNASHERNGFAFDRVSKQQMQTIVDNALLSKVTMCETDAHRAAIAYVAGQIDPSFEVVDGAQFHSKPFGREVWRFYICCQHGPLHPIQVDCQTGEAISLTSDEIRIVREKAAILAASKSGRLPLNEQGYVLGEYARRQADNYLGMEASLFYSARDGVFVPLAPPRWQFCIQLRLPGWGVLGVLGMLDVDALTGEVIPLTKKQIKHIRERGDALVEFRTPTAAA
jgi:hypothetical protein